jgi:hypothetical protein
MTSWVDSELEGSKFKDERLGKRFLKVVRSLSQKIGDSVPIACQDWANTKAAYRFFSNRNLSEDEILHGHFESTKSRYDETEGPILVLHDTTEITYKRIKPAKIGYTRKCASPKGLFHQEVKRAQCGILMHPSLAVTTEGLPLGLCANRFWSRDKFKGVHALYRKRNSTRIPIDKKESYRWIEGVKNSNDILGSSSRLVHIGDREGDMYELFQMAVSQGSNFLVRIKVDRRTDDETITIKDVMKTAKIKGFYQITYRDKNGEEVTAELEIKFERITIKPSYGLKSKLYPDTEVTVIFAQERGKPKGTREPIDWKLMTSLPIDTLGEAIEKLQWYALRWKIEIFFKILKSGCKVQESKLRTADALSKLISIYCILAWRIFWMTMMQRETDEVSPKAGLTETEIKTLDYLKPDSKKSKKNLSNYILKIAKLGGYLARASDPYPGNKVIWKGMERLADILIGVEVGMKLVGN